MSGYCEICGRTITGRADRATCSPACKKARQRDAARAATTNRADPPETPPARDAAEPHKGDKTRVRDPHHSDAPSSGTEDASNA